MESDDFTRHYIIRYLSARELVLPPLVVAVRCEERHFLILYACVHEVSFPGQILRSLVWERHLVHKGNKLRARLAWSLPVVVGKVCEHHTGKALNSAANL